MQIPTCFPRGLRQEPQRARVTGRSIGPAPESPSRRCGQGRRKRPCGSAGFWSRMPSDHGDAGETRTGKLPVASAGRTPLPRASRCPARSRSREGAPSTPALGSLEALGASLPHPKLFLRARRHLPRPQRAFRGGASPLRSVVSGGGACGRRRF